MDAKPEKGLGRARSVDSKIHKVPLFGWSMKTWRLARSVEAWVNHQPGGFPRPAFSPRACLCPFVPYGQRRRTGDLSGVAVLIPPSELRPPLCVHGSSGRDRAARSCNHDGLMQFSERSVLYLRPRPLQDVTDSQHPAPPRDHISTNAPPMRNGLIRLPADCLRQILVND
jgi:hypothetical protein